MAYKNKEDAKKYQHEYYLKFRKPKYISHPRIKKTKEEKLANKRAWYHANLEKARVMAKKSREKHKEQRRLDNKLWRENHKGYLKKNCKEYHKRYYLKNKEKIDRKNKLYAINNREKVVKNVQRYVARNRKKVSKYNKEYQQTIYGGFRTTRYGAKRRNKEFNISFKEFSEIILKSCYYCGENKEKRGIDRINNDLGYTLENSVSCCKICNYMKQTMTKSQFLKHIEKIYKHTN